MHVIFRVLFFFKEYIRTVFIPDMRILNSAVETLK
jgi:hypothetical protein